MSEVLAAAGVLAAAAAAAAAIVLPPSRGRSAAMLAALILFPVLILGDQWDSRQIADLRDDELRLIGLALAAVLASCALALLFRRWPLLLPLAIVAALPFRIPLEAGGDTANLLVPLYLVIAGGVLATAIRDWDVGRSDPPAGGAVGGTAPEEALATGGGGGSPAATGPAGQNAVVWLPRILAGVVVLYALQTLYSPTSPRACRTSASSSSPSRSPTRCFETSIGTGGCSPLSSGSSRSRASSSCWSARSST